MNMLRRTALVSMMCTLMVGTLALSGCGDDGGGRDTGPADTGTVDSATPDTSVPDGGVPDGTPGDSSTPDSTTPDTGVPPTGMCPAGDCDLLTNAGCEAGNACYFAAPAMGEAAVPTCAPAGTGGDGDACTMIQDCQEGFVCDNGAGVCRHYCCDGADTGCPTGQSCLVSIVDDMMMPTGVGICRIPDTCDLLAQTGCTDGQGCYPGGGDGTVLCVGAGTAASGEACSFANDCVPGAVCLATNTCATLCNTTDMTGCADGDTCNGLTGAPEGVGVCVAP